MGRYTSLDSSQPFDRHLSYGQYPELSRGAPGAWLPSAGGQRQVFLATFLSALAAAAKSRQSCPTLCDPTDCSPPGSPVPGILQARVLEWGAIAFPVWVPLGLTNSSSKVATTTDDYDTLCLLMWQAVFHFSLVIPRSWYHFIMSTTIANTTTLNCCASWEKPYCQQVFKLCTLGLFSHHLFHLRQKPSYQNSRLTSPSILWPTV